MSDIDGSGKLELLPDLVNDDAVCLRSGRGVQSLQRLGDGLAAELKSGMMNGKEQFGSGFLAHAPSLFGSAMESHPGIVRADGHDRPCRVASSLRPSLASSCLPCLRRTGSGSGPSGSGSRCIRGKYRCAVGRPSDSLRARGWWPDRRAVPHPSRSRVLRHTVRPAAGRPSGWP